MEFTVPLNPHSFVVLFKMRANAGTLGFASENRAMFETVEVLGGVPMVIDVNVPPMNMYPNVSQ
jgi:hypothetical protein